MGLCRPCGPHTQQTAGPAGRLRRPSLGAALLVRQQASWGAGAPSSALSPGQGGILQTAAGSNPQRAGLNPSGTLGSGLVKAPALGLQAVQTDLGLFLKVVLNWNQEEGIAQW